MKNNVARLSGHNIYLNRYGEPVYYNILNKKGYLVPKGDEQKFKVFYYRYSIIFIVLVLLGDYFKSLQNTLLVGAGVILLTEIYFRFFYLKGLKEVKNFKKENKTSRLEETINSDRKDKVLMKMVAYALLGILIVINAIQQNFNVVFIAISVGICVYSVYLSILNGIAFTRMKR